MSGQDKWNPAFWLVTSVGEMGPFLPFHDFHWSHKENVVFLALQ